MKYAALPGSRCGQVKYAQQQPEMVLHALLQDLQAKIFFEKDGQGYCIISVNKKYRDGFNDKITQGRDRRMEKPAAGFLFKSPERQRGPVFLFKRFPAFFPAPKTAPHADET
jgi:hypothetical protein